MHVIDWVHANGGGLEISRKLGVSRAALYSWIRGYRVPNAIHLRALIRLSKNVLTFESILQNIVDKPASAYLRSHPRKSRKTGRAA